MREFLRSHCSEGDLRLVSGDGEVTRAHTFFLLGNLPHLSPLLQICETCLDRAGESTTFIIPGKSRGLRTSQFSLKSSQTSPSPRWRGRWTSSTCGERFDPSTGYSGGKSRRRGENPSSFRLDVTTILSWRKQNMKWTRNRRLRMKSTVILI